MKWTITSGFGEVDSVHHIPHSGIDFALPLGTPIRAFESGVVQKVLDEGTKSFGKSIWIKFNDGYTAVLGHLDDVYVKPGEHVFNTELIARSGNTGFSTGPHLHLGVLNPAGQWIDPSKYVLIDQVSDPAVMYGAQDWADQVVQGWFSKMGDALVSGLEDLVKHLGIVIDHNLPEISVTLLVVGGFMKMFGSQKWSSRLFVAAGVGVTCLILL